MRQIILDTETTGLDPKQGHRIIEIGGVELVNRRLTGKRFHKYINPERVIEDEALAVHGISNEFLADKPSFKQVVEDFINYISGAELIIHNAPFDIGFINNELTLVRSKVRRVTEICKVFDTLALARKMHPGQRNNLDALCKRYGIDNFQRDLHGALLDAEILAQVYLIMTGGQTTLFTEAHAAEKKIAHAEVDQKRVHKQRENLVVLQPTEKELLAHEEMIKKIEGDDKLWQP